MGTTCNGWGRLSPSSCLTCQYVRRSLLVNITNDCPWALLGYALWSGIGWLLDTQVQLVGVTVFLFQFQLSHSIVSDSLRIHGLQHARPPCPRQLLEFTQTHVHCVGDAIQLSHPLSAPSPPAFNLSQHQGFFQWVSSSHQVAKVLEFQLQHQSFQWTLRTDLL